jgi:HK97 family phage major capsid protein
MNIQQINDAIVAKSAELDTLLAKAEPTMDEVTAAKTLNSDIESLTNQAEELKSLEAIKAANAKRSAEIKTPVNKLPQTADIKVGESAAKKNSDDKEYKSLVTGLFIAGMNSEAARQKYADVTGVEYKTHTQSNDATGGLFVPQEVASFIIDLKDSYGVFRRNTNVVGMGSETLKIFRTGDDVSAAWIGEGGTYTASDMSFDSIVLTAKKLTSYALISEELLANSTVSLGQQFAQSVARQFAKAEDSAGFLGDGTSTYGGILGLDGRIKKVVTDGGGTWTTDADKSKAGSVQVISGNAFSEAVITDFTAGARKVPTYALAGAKWYMNKVAFGATVERLAYAQGGATAAELASSFGQRFLGYPVEFVDVMPSADGNSQIFAYFGNLALASTMGDRQAVSIRQDASLGFQTDTIHVKASEYVDIRVHEVGNYSATASTRTTGPIVAFSSQNA